MLLYLIWLILGMNVSYSYAAIYRISVDVTTVNNVVCCWVGAIVKVFVHYYTLRHLRTKMELL